MNNPSHKRSSGLRGHIAGQTSISTVGVRGSGLSYRGYDVIDLAHKSTFEEVAYLLLYGKLPNATELRAYLQTLKGMRQLPPELKQALETIPANTHPMDVLRTGCSLLGNLERETHFDQQLEKANRMLAIFPSIINYWYHFSHHQKRIQENSTEATIGGYFLELLHRQKPSVLHRQVMNVSLILYAEHEFNASTFAARVCASTLSDIHSAITAAIGTLRGPLHGGANEAASELISQWKTPEEAETALMEMLERKELIMGFGHAVYTDADPRNVVIQQWAKHLSEAGAAPELYAIAERVDEVMKREKNLFPNVDFYHAPVYQYMNIPRSLFTPLFVCSRVTGWCAHIFEQRSNNRIIRPKAAYVGPSLQKVLPLAERI